MNLNKVKEKIKSTRGNRLWIAMGLFCLLFLIFFITVFVLKKNYDGQIEGEKDSYISNEYDQQVKDQNDKEYETLAQYTDESGDKTLALKTSDDGGTYLTLDGEKLPIQGNIASPAISPSGERICYSKYAKNEGEDAHSTYSGKVYCMNAGSLEEKEIYSFGENIYLSIGVNQKYLVYSLSNGEIGVVNLNSKEKSKIVTLQMLPESDPNKIVFVNEQSAVIDPNDYEKLVNKKQRTININLTDLTYVEE